MKSYRVQIALLFAGTLPFASLAPAVEISVSPGESIQAAIVQAQDGDVILLDVGTYRGDIDFLGKQITVSGKGRKTRLRGTGTGSVVTFQRRENALSVLRDVRITGGNAPRGGGIFISDASPTILKTFIRYNKASVAGSGIHITGNSRPFISNNEIYKNRRSRGGGDPHGIQIVGASPVVINNTIAKNDSNGMLISGASDAIVLNNIFARNGTKKKDRRGRGICDFSSSRVTLQHNLFYKNVLSALLVNGTDYKKITQAEDALNDPLVFGNNDRNPKFKCISRTNLRKSSGARDRGHPDLKYNDRDGTRNDIGRTGGPMTGVP